MSEPAALARRRAILGLIACSAMGCDVVRSEQRASSDVASQAPTAPAFLDVITDFEARVLNFEATKRNEYALTFLLRNLSDRKQPLPALKFSLTDFAQHEFFRVVIPPRVYGNRISTLQVHEVIRRKFIQNIDENIIGESGAYVYQLRAVRWF